MRCCGGGRWASEGGGRGVGSAGGDDTRQHVEEGKVGRQDPQRLLSNRIVVVHLAQVGEASLPFCIKQLLPRKIGHTLSKEVKLETSKSLTNAQH